MNIEARKPDAKRVAELAQEMAKKTRGRAIIEKLRAQRGDLIEKREVLGETVYIKRMAWPDIMRVKLAMPRDVTGAINLSNDDHLRGVTIAMIATGVVVGVPETEEGEDVKVTEEESLLEEITEKPLDATPVYTIAEASELVDEPGALAYVSALFNTITDVNPNVLPNSEAANSSKKPTPVRRD